MSKNCLHSNTAGKPRVAGRVNKFIRQLWGALDDPQTQDIFRWGQEGTSLIIADYEQFANAVMPRAFGLTNWRSFHRQLNFYRFKKINSFDRNMLEFKNEFFVRGRPHLLPNIRRSDTERIRANRIRANMLLANKATSEDESGASDHSDPSVSASVPKKESGMPNPQNLRVVINWGKSSGPISTGFRCQSLVPRGPGFMLPSLPGFQFFESQVKSKQA